MKELYEKLSSWVINYGEIKNENDANNFVLWYEGNIQKKGRREIIYDITKEMLNSGNFDDYEEGFYNMLELRWWMLDIMEKALKDYCEEKGIEYKGDEK